jgi:hypothetical protein
VAIWLDFNAHLSLSPIMSTATLQSLVKCDETFIHFFIFLFLNRVAQPALLYLVPLTLLPIIFLSLKRKEFLLVWNGMSKAKKENDVNLVWNKQYDLLGLSKLAKKNRILVEVDNGKECLLLNTQIFRSTIKRL